MQNATLSATLGAETLKRITEGEPDDDVEQINEQTLQETHGNPLFVPRLSRRSSDLFWLVVWCRWW